MLIPIDDNSILNAHFHFNNSQVYPPEVFYNRFPFPKWIVLGLADAARNNAPAVLLIDIVADYVGGKNYRLKETLDIFNSNLNEVVDHSLLQMKKAGVTHGTPLMLDLAPACRESYIEIPFDIQLEFFGTLHKKSNGRLMPFAMIDPRRPHFQELVTKTWKTGNFFGFKVYPPLGVNYNVSTSKNSKEVKDNVEFFLTFCEEHRIPITTHCSPGGIMGEGVTKDEAHRMTEPKNWVGALNRHPNLILNLGHFGGNSSFIDHFINTKKTPDRDNWAYQIVQLLQMEEFYPNIFADLSFHEGVIFDASRYKKAFINAMNNPFVVNRTLIGDDSDLTAIYYTMPKFYKEMEDISKDEYDVWKMISNLNPREFLNI